MKIENLNFGEVLHSLRTYKKLKIEELADGICSAEDIELFEKDHKYPTLEQFSKLADKLNVDVNYLFDFTTSSRFNYSVTVSNLINDYKKKRDYRAIYEIIQKEKANPLFHKTPNQQYLLWHEGICVYYIENNKELAIQLLEKAIKLTNTNFTNLTEREIDILSSIAIIEKDAQNFDTALSLFSEAINHLSAIPYKHDPKIEIKVFYSYAQLLTKVGRYHESLRYCLEGIQICISKDLNYQFADFHYQAGENYIRLGELEKGNEYMEKAITIFNIQGNSKFAQLVKTEYRKLLADSN
ncbi:helix-turn-helix domain-containing protein [Bacillus sp. S/N-304-OC-R1]|uniref:helix-turn-helix domain-containing protein n=1 Tax=Bacillus sp. S/N-304-OC-R1 TaxID=2758034 RepID=UPI001C8D63E8|nr:helix-turn-helix domain-containing protein [Bacillus sp. S/N-304-OC-R1]MBY0124113.1 helix-turn-helix transcriptional regulator [Bacillus sp. S/N-304-OC-R1]